MSNIWNKPRKQGGPADREGRFDWKSLYALSLKAKLKVAMDLADEMERETADPEARAVLYSVIIDLDRAIARIEDAEK